LLKWQAQFARWPHVVLLILPPSPAAASWLD